MQRYLLGGGGLEHRGHGPARSAPRRLAVAAASRGPGGGPPGRARRAGGGDRDRGRGDDPRSASGRRHPPGRGTARLRRRGADRLRARAHHPRAGDKRDPAEPDPERLRALGAVAARISSVKLTPAPALPVRSRPIECEDFAGMRREQGASDLLRAAEAAVAATRPHDDQPGLVHGDLWHGNTLWDDYGRLTAVLDWDCAGVGQGRHRPRLAALRRGLVPRRRSRRACPARLGGRGGQARERRPLLGRRRGARLSARHGLVPGIDGRSGPPRPDLRGDARAARRLPRGRALPASSRLGGFRAVAQAACRPGSHIHHPEPLAVASLLLAAPHRGIDAER